MRVGYEPEGQAFESLCSPVAPEMHSRLCAKSPFAVL